MTHAATLLFTRRTRVERRILTILRGEAPDPSDCFARLRASATAHGLVIFSPGTPYLNADELTLLSWIADAQRVASLAAIPAEHDLAANIKTCAHALLDMRLRLSALSLYGERPAMIAGRPVPARHVQ